MLVEFGFQREHADVIFGLVGDYNPRGMRAFEKAGFEVHSKEPSPPGAKGRYSVHLVMMRDKSMVGPHSHKLSCTKPVKGEGPG